RSEIVRCREVGRTVPQVQINQRRNNRRGCIDVKMVLSEKLARERAAFSNSVSRALACCMTVEVASLAAIRNADGLARMIAGEGASGAEVAKHYLCRSRR